MIFGPGLGPGVQGTTTSVLHVACVHHRLRCFTFYKKLQLLIPYTIPLCRVSFPIFGNWHPLKIQFFPATGNWNTLKNFNFRCNCNPLSLTVLTSFSVCLTVKCSVLVDRLWIMWCCHQFIKLYLSREVYWPGWLALQVLSCLCGHCAPPDRGSVTVTSI